MSDRIQRLNKPTPANPLAELHDTAHYVVRDEDWGRVWGANLSKARANYVKEFIAGRQLSRTVLFELMPTDPKLRALCLEAEVCEAEITGYDEEVAAAIRAEVAARQPQPETHVPSARVLLPQPTKSVRVAAAPAQRPAPAPRAQPMQTLPAHVRDTTIVQGAGGQHAAPPVAPPGNVEDFDLGDDEDLDGAIAAAEAEAADTGGNGIGTGPIPSS